MPIQIKTQKVPSKAVIEKQKQQIKEKKKAAKALKAAVRKAREVAAESILFGSDLFEPVAKREREIVIHFGERFTHDRTRISLDGKFAFRQVCDFYFDFFYFLEPLLEYPDNYVVFPSEKCWLFDRLTIEEVEELAIKICRAEFAEEKAKLLEEIKKQDKERQRELDEADEAFIKAQKEEQENETITGASLFENIEQAGRPEAKEQKKIEIPVKDKEEKTSSIPLVKTKEVSSVETKNIFTPVFRKVN